MFIGRSDELARLREQLDSDEKSVILVYGKRRVGKSTLISEAFRDYHGAVINYICVESTFQGNLELLGRNLCAALGLPDISFASMNDLFAFAGKQTDEILIVLDEYQYLKKSEKANTVDSIMQSVIDTLPPNVKLILCGSYVTVMKELLEEENPLFGRFTEIIHLKEFDYYDSSLFTPESTVREKIERYAVFGGSPYVQSVIDDDLSIEQNIKKYLLHDTGILRVYIESVMLKEVKKAFDVRILEILGNGKKRYRDIKSALNQDDNGLLDKQLRNLIDMEVITKTAPINRQNDRNKQFYQISDNLMRFYFTFIFGSSGMISRLGADAYYSQYIEGRLGEFISRRFEDIAKEYFSREVRSGERTDVLDIGTYWYDDPAGNKSGELDVVLKGKGGYAAYECKYYSEPMSDEDCRIRAENMTDIADLDVRATGFICSAGFRFKTDEYELISGEDIYV